MADATENMGRMVNWVGRHRGLLLPAMAAGLIFIILVPLPPGLMDLLLLANITLAAVVLLTAIFVASPLEFSVFPSVLLGATLMRLALNIATTRLVLTAGADGRTMQEAQLAAGSVIWTFSQFVGSGSLAVGVILFAIIAVIQFIVITRGASRISEVSARFVLDAMPGKQMAIDADLNSGLITEDSARRRRSEIAQEADFYGAMDGASKFLRGDAVAAVIITFVCMLGGLYVGMMQYGWKFSQTLDLFTRLAIGDGLVMQVPALLISIASALIVTRSTRRTNLGEDVVGQLLSRPVVLVITAAFLAALMLTSLPKAPLLLMGAACAGLAWLLSRRQAANGQPPTAAETHGETARQLPARDDVQDLLTVDPMRIELGFGLVRLVDPLQKGDLLDRIAALRRQMAAELGLLVPPVKIKDDLRLEAHGYIIRIRGAKVAAGKVYPGQLLALGGEQVRGKLTGRATTESVFGTPATWIGPHQREQAERLNYTVVEPSVVLITHLGEVLRRHAAELLSRQQVARMLDGAKARCGSLVEEVTGRISLGQVQRVLQNLLRESVPVRDLEGILEAMSEALPRTQDVDELTEHVRAALGRTISQQYCGEDGRLWCVCLESQLEETLSSRLQKSPRRTLTSISPELAGKVAMAVGQGLERLQRQGRKPIVLCAPQVRPAVRELIASAQPGAAVLAYNEIDAVEVNSIASVGIES